MTGDEMPGGAVGPGAAEPGAIGPRAAEAGAAGMSAGEHGAAGAAHMLVVPPTGEILGIIDRLEDLLDRSDLAELEVQAGEFGLVLRKPTLFTTPSMDGAAGGASGSGVEHPAAHPEPEPHPRHHRVLAPLTGMWYLTPSPDAAPYVKVGQEVVKGQVIGLIEAMKLFNEIKSDASGRVVSILAEPGVLVKQKQPLIELEPV